ncbi:MAG: MAC/perforin domain-containing protein [Pseudomonadota bacterium]
MSIRSARNTALFAVISSLSLVQPGSAQSLPDRVFTGCDGETKAAESSASRIRGRFNSPDAQVTQRDFASLPIFDLDELPEEAEGLCWARLDGVWRDNRPIRQAPWQGDSIWAVDEPGLIDLGNGQYSKYQYLVIVPGADPDKSLNLTDGMGGKRFVKFTAVDDVKFADVIAGKAQRKSYQATSNFKYGNRLDVELSLNGKIAARMPKATFERPEPAISRMDMQNQLELNDAFIIQYQLDNLAASRRGYYIITQDTFKLMVNGKKEVFARGNNKRYYVEEKRVVPLGLKYVPNDLQGMIYRKSLVTSAKAMRETLAVSLGVESKAEEKLTNTKVSVGYKAATYSFKAMRQSETVGQAIGYSVAKKYALVVDHAFNTLSGDFINAVDYARRENRYQALIDAFGTHYAYAVTYGASAKMTQSINNSSYQEQAGRDSSFAANAGGQVYGVGGSVSASIAKGEVNSESGSIGSEKVSFIAVGGNGSWDQGGYAAGDRSAPILLHLRPLHELLNPMNFPGQPEIYVKVRKNLKRALDFYLQQNATELSDESFLPTIRPKEKPEKWYVYIRHVDCQRKSSIGPSIYTLEGKVSVKAYQAVQGNGDASAKDLSFSVKCRPKKKKFRKTIDYAEGDNGLLVLRGYREEMMTYVVEYDFDWKFKPNLGKRRKNDKKYTAPKPLHDGLDIDDKKTYKWTMKTGPTVPKVVLHVRFKRKQ